jgi:tetratricopeptide (TPR) repeat protein
LIQKPIKSFCWGGSNGLRTASGKASTIFNRQSPAIQATLLPYIGLADSYFGLQYTEIVPPLQFKAQERAAILKALSLNDSLAEAHTSLAHAQEMEDWDFAAAEKEYRRAVELNLSYALAHHWFGNDLAIRGRSQEALEESRKAMTLDPLSVLYRASYAHRIAYARRFDEAADTH